MAAAQSVGLEAPNRARARDRLREQIGDIVDAMPPVLDASEVPMFPDADSRRWFIAEQLAQGFWRTENTAILAQAWGLSERTVINYTSSAAQHVRIATHDIERLTELAATRIAKVAAGQDPALALKAAELQLKLTGHLKGGAEHHAPSNAELEAQMIQALRDPDDMMTRWLRAAMSDPGEGMRALMAEFAVPVTAGVELT